MSAVLRHPTRAAIHLDRLAHNLRLLRELAGGRPVWPAVKANAYGHGAVPVARELVAQGCDTLCVAHPSEALELLEAGVRARFLLLTAALPEASEAIAAHGFEPALCARETAQALALAAERAGRRLDVHVKVDTGMGRVGIRPEELPAFLAACRALPALRVRGLMSHFPRADEADKSFSREQIRSFAKLREVSAAWQVPSKWTRAIGASSASITLSGRNLFTWSDWTSLDPETFWVTNQFDKSNQTFTPQLAQFVTSIKLTF